MSKRVLTAVQCSGKLHIGNVMSVVLPTLELSNDDGNEVFIFLADLHSLTTVKDPKILDEYRRNAAVVWLSLGLDTDKVVFYRQSKVRGICELTWILNCLTPFPMLANAHAFKDKSSNLSNVNVGLFDYPVLMAADILIVGAEYIPVGKDQLQHIEITRDIATFYNNRYGNMFTLPQALINSNLEIIPGIDGRKMSKSYGNAIDIFVAENELKKTIMSIKTDSKSIDEPKDPENCTLFKIYSAVADKEDVESLRGRYVNGGISYKETKDMLYETIVTRFGEARKKYDDLIKNRDFIDGIFVDGERKVQDIVDCKISEIKGAVML